MADVLAYGRQLLWYAAPEESRVFALRDRLWIHAQAADSSLDEAACWLSCVLALRAVCAGSYGVGALILDGEGCVIEAGWNQLLDPYFRSDAHAEMIVLSSFEARWANRSKQDLTLYSSLEPCPMCYARLLTSGIGRVVYLADDELAGMVSRADQMPPLWRELAATREFCRAEADEELRQLAMDIFLVNGRELDERLKALG
ncbi:nucleoside deaminase [Methylolobus aquaticus]